MARVAVAVVATDARAEGEDQLLGLSVRSLVQEGDRPALLLAPTVAVKRVGVTLKRKADDKVILLESGPLAKGQEAALEWEQAPGNHAYEAHIEATPAKGDPIVLGIGFEASTVGPLVVEAQRKGSELDARKLTFTSSRATTKAKVTVYGEGDRVVGHGEQDYGRVPPIKPVTVGWTQDEAAVRRIALEVHDDMGFWATVEVRAVFVEPWEDRIYFAFGSDAVEPGEKSKLDATYERITDALETARREVGDSLDLRLYVAGYTDTVGTPASNQDLSERRAKSIGRYLAGKGLTLPVYYQGFGESVLAVKTADETENERNRRTVYVLSSQTPVSELFPKKSWKKL
jgi:outer membrane protein OmpA-like peptidoglycan-associated protein